MAFSNPSDHRIFQHLNAGGPRTLEKNLIQCAAFHCNFGVRPTGKWNADPSTADPDKFNRVQSAMGQLTNRVGNPEPGQHRPTGGFQAIAANFLAWKGFAFEDNRSETALRANDCASGTGWTSSDNRNINPFHSKRGVLE